MIQEIGIRVISLLIGFGSAIFVLSMFKKPKEKTHRNIFAHLDEKLAFVTSVYGRQPYPGEMADFLKEVESKNLSKDSWERVAHLCRNNRITGPLF